MAQYETHSRSFIFINKKFVVQYDSVLTATISLMYLFVNLAQVYLWLLLISRITNCTSNNAVLQCNV
jgi:hypothetical protein